MKFNSQLEELEQQHPELIQDLQQIYQITGEEREALSRIEARLNRSAPRQQQELETRSPSSRLEYIPLTARSRPDSKRLWSQSMGLIAALLVVAFMTGAIVPTFLLMNGNSHIYTPYPINRQINALMPLGFIMFTEQEGWIGDLGFQGLVRRTTDGGKTWKTVKPPQELGGKPFWAYALDKDTLHLQPVEASGSYFPGDSLLYFYRTVNAGKTWQRYNWPTTPAIAKNGLANFDWTFLGPHHGWVNVSPARKPENGASGEGLPKIPEQTLFHTDDGGKTWQQVARLPFPYQIADLTFIDSQTGWLITTVNHSSDPNNIDPQSYSIVPFVTYDGGRTWKQMPIPDPTQIEVRLFGLQDLTFFSKQDGYVIVTSVQRDDTINNYLLRTQDGGDSWQFVGKVIPEALENYRYPWTILDTTHVFNGLYMYTLSNGQWVKTSTLPPGSEELNVSFEFFSSQVGMVVVDDYVLYKTQDGGKTWQKIGTLPKGL